MSERSRRAVAVVAVVALLAIGGLIDRSSGPRLAGAAVTPPVPVAAPAGAISSSWFCAGATDGGPVPAKGLLVVANAGSAAVTARIQLVDSGGHRGAETLRVGPHSSGTAPESTGSDGTWAGAIVTVDGGSVAVEQVVDGALGRSESPCADSGSPEWYFPTGQTRVNADEELLLLNPYPSDTIVDLSFETEQGVEQPVAFQGLTVPAGQLVAVDIGSRLRRRASIATTVRTRSGNIVAWRTAWVTPPPANAPIVGTPAAAQPLADPALAVAGIDSALGSPLAATSWTWPDGLAGPNLDEQFAVYNPGSVTASVRLSVGLAQGSAEPFSFSVAAGQVVTVVSEQEARIPPGVAHDATLVSTNGVPVVALRSVTAAGGGTPPRSGVSTLFGAVTAAPSWLVPAPDEDSTHTGSLVVYNPGPGPASVRVAGTAVLVPPATRSQLPLPPNEISPLEVVSTVPVFVEYDLLGVSGATGISLSLAVPLS